MRVLLVDDEKLQLIRLDNEVRKILKDDCEIICYSNPVEASEYIENNKVDIAFLDIEMPVINGIKLAKMLKSSNPQVNIIFVTAYDNYAMNAYQLHASGYLSKPVNEEKIRTELDNLRYPVEMNSGKKLQIKCFGNFDLFFDGKPIKFSRKKSKELFAYLVDREGAAVNINELNAVLWEEDHKSYCRNLIADIQLTLKNAGINDVFVKRFNECYINVDNVYCDAYEYKKNNPDAIRMFRGEYMMQYSWPIFNGLSKD